MIKNWKVKDAPPDEFKNKFEGQHPIVTQLLYNRGLESQSEIDDFFDPGYEKIHDPFLFRDMKKAVERVWQAIEKKEKILIHGDYDADGVTSSAIVFRTLKLLGADAQVFIPHRETDGYGLNMNNLNTFIAQKAKLLITVDCGITNVDEIAYLTEKGVDVIVTDHHEPPEVLPKPFATLDPKVGGSGYPFQELAGAGVAYKLVQAILSDTEKLSKYENEFMTFGGVAGFQKWLLDIVAIGTVADVSPIIGENRVLVKWGLKVLEKTRWVGLQKLLESIGSKGINSFTIGFQLAPRLNAAGRMNHASVAYELLVSDDALESERIAQELQENNQARQQVIIGALEEATAQLEEIEKKKIIFVYNENWLPGIVGLIAGRLADKYYRPAVAMTLCNGNVTGSGRSIDEFNITEGLRTVSDHLARFGGHPGACGFTLNEVEVREQFENDFTLHAEKELADLDLQPVLEVDAEVKTSQIDFDFLAQLEKFSPFGERNPKPLFIINNLQVVAMDAIGKDKTHLRINFKQDGPQLYKMLWFGKAKEWLEKLRVGDTIDVVCELGINEWNGNREFEFKAVDMKVKGKR
ncbi:single-stranded-DNA-specific exonuclease RecJ [Candidatus Kuenenbacteria bacterium]|nr:single-stranded-DNA-specific exonuclease RecJ [Candidatus Kuenenbacteria bacterium]